MPRGPEGGVLTFDASMIPPRAGDGGSTVDAGTRPRDGGRRDGGTPVLDGGPRDSGIARGYCEGSVTPCSYRTSLTCEDGSGCFTTDECTGFSTSCYSMFSHYTCISQQGCVWSSSSSRCSGIAWSCDSFFGLSTCIGQDGCDWEDTCDGTPLPCSSWVTRDVCNEEPGCYWMVE